MKPSLAILACTALVAGAAAQAAAPAPAISDAQYATALAAPWRAAENTRRDAFRHPAETLKFFGLRANQRVIEITPGGGWYSEILAPMLKDQGHYVAALQAPSSGDYYAKAAASLRDKFKAAPAQYANAEFIEFDPQAPVFGAPGSADLVLTFRNVHNWLENGSTAQMFSAFFQVLKPGGVLGVVDHRAKPGARLAEIKDSGYLPVDYVVNEAIKAGFKLDGRSDINTNPKDTKDYPEGVWTLPPTLKMGEKDRAKYVAIGESDRMTLRFVKPAAAR